MVKEVDFSKKGKKPKYKQLGLTQVKNDKGSLIGYKDKSGNYIPRRQYDKMIGKPGKGSPGHKERTDVKRRKVDAKSYAKGRGHTLDGLKYGKEPTTPRDVLQTFDKHRAAILHQRMSAIQLKYDEGLIDRKKWQNLRDHAWEEDRLEKKLAELYEKLENNSDKPGGKQYSNAARRKVEDEYRKTREKYDRHHRQLDKAKIVPPKGSDLEHGYYH